MRLPLLATFAAIAALALSPAAAQRRPPTPEQRIDRLEYQVRQVQKSVFPKGRPADTAGFVDDPAATQAQANQLSNRLDAIEQQLAEIVRTSEESGSRLGPRAVLLLAPVAIWRRSRSATKNNTDKI